MFEFLKFDYFFLYLDLRTNFLMGGLLLPFSPWMKTQGRESIGAKLVANMITTAGADRVLACDLHSGQSMGYFDIPVDHVYGQVCCLCLIGDGKRIIFF